MAGPVSLIKRLWRQMSSLADACFCKLTALTLGRRPSRTCQIPQLYQMVQERLGTVVRGQFVEVGAYDGERFSNTSWLADNGWRGIYIEPSPEFSRLCRLRHCLNDVQVLNVAAGEASSEATLMQVGSLSTMSAHTFEEYGRIPWASQRIQRNCEKQTTKIRTLDSLLRQCGKSPGFELLVVDVEGYEENVFRGFDLNYWQPRLVIVELCDAHPDFADNQVLVDSAKWVRHRILEAGYFEVYRDDINTVFQRRAGGEGRSTAEVRSAA